MATRAFVAPGFQARSIYLRVSPTPSNLAERRSVLRILKKQGVIEYFKKLRVCCTPSTSSWSR